MRLTFTIARFNPETDSRPHEEEYRLEVSRGMTVLEALIRIKNEQDGSLALRYSCRSAICGSCAMEINGSEKLACKTSVRRELERHERLRIAPLKNLPVIKDLIVDMTSFWGKIREVTPWLMPASQPGTEPPAGQMALPPASYQFHNVDACIMCGACVASCTSHEVSRRFLGPAALAKAERFLADPRESPASKRQRLAEMEEEHGIWDCTRCNFCVQVCPKDVKPMEAIVRLRRAAIEAGFDSTGGARHITGFLDIVRREGRLNEARMPLKVVGFSFRRLLHVVPLGLRMWLKGKVPNPLSPPIAGIAQVRTIFRGLRRSANPANPAA
ncbi:MAG: succinate dehydrogenase iron-sulfur subunit [Nitrospirota bacterium]